MDRGCTTKSLLRALSIADTKTHLKTLKLEFYKRLIPNKFTEEILGQVEKENTKDSERDEGIKGVAGNHVDRTPLKELKSNRAPLKP